MGYGLRRRLSQIPSGPSTSQASSTILTKGDTRAPAEGVGELPRQPLMADGRALAAYADRMEIGGAASAGTCLIAGCGYVGGRLARRMGGMGPALLRDADSGPGNRIHVDAPL